MNTQYAVRKAASYLNDAASVYVLFPVTVVLIRIGCIVCGIVFTAGIAVPACRVTVTADRVTFIAGITVAAFRILLL